VEDTEIAYRIHYNKYKIKNVADAYVYTYCPQTYNLLKNQRIRWYRGLYRTLLQYKEMVFNQEYGNFSMFHLPTMTFSVVLMFLALYLYLSTFFEYLALQANIVDLVGFGYYVPVWGELFKSKSMLTFNFLSWFPIIATFAAGFYVLRLAYKISRERLRDSILYLLPGILFYYSILTVFWIMALSKEWSGARSRW
jgi:cellulose synthase/poly-beta-1,6-N-acetylglucosamine synthase-like glycosyltransferase